MSLSNLVLFLLFLVGVFMFWVVVLTLPILVEAVAVFWKVQKEKDLDSIMGSIEDARAISVVSIAGILSTVLIMGLNFFYKTDMIFIYTFVSYVFTLVLSSISLRKLHDKQADLVTKANDVDLHHSLYAGFIPRERKMTFAEKAEVEDTEGKMIEEVEATEAEVEVTEAEVEVMEAEDTVENTEETELEEEAKETEADNTKEVASDAEAEVEDTEDKMSEEVKSAEETEETEKPEATEETPEEEVSEKVEQEPETPEAEDFETVQK